MKTIEQKLKNCSRCQKTTIHQRNNTSIGFVMILIHIVLMVLTAGAWLVLLIIWNLLTAKIGGWKCERCGK